MADCMLHTCHPTCRQSHRRNRQVRACQGLLEKLRGEQAAARATNSYPAASCPVCLEDFQPPLQQQEAASDGQVRPPAAATKLADPAPSVPPLPGAAVGISRNTLPLKGVLPKKPG